jgi:tripartite-type tricarboxylate transporter receptor subunit TctC
MRFAAALAAVLLTCCPALLQAQSYPSRPVRWIVPYAPGGNTDMIARVVGARLSDGLGQPVLVENRPGAATLLGSEFVARSAPDGYTILLATSTTLAINPHLYRKLPYDPVRDFAPLALIARTPMVLVVHPALPVKSIRDLVALARSRPGQLAYGSAGTGSPSFMSMEMLKTATKRLRWLSNVGKIPCARSSKASANPKSRSAECVSSVASQGTRRQTAAPRSRVVNRSLVRSTPNSTCNVKEGK